MKLRFWGVRGSINSPISPDAYSNKLKSILSLTGGADLSDISKIDSFIEKLPPYLKTTYGGNTSCVTVSDESTLIIFDAGTGIRSLGNELLSGKFFSKDITEYHLFFSHLHLDHINGLPFFAPVHFPKTKINFYSHHPDFEKMLKTQQDFNFFPVSLESRPCKKSFTVLEEGANVEIGGFKITSKKLNHPNGSYAYRAESLTGKSIVYSTDAEFTAASALESFFGFYKDADVLIFDTQYNFNELAGRFSFGHSTAEIGVDAAVNAGVGKLMLFHHNHESDDIKIYEMSVSAKKYLAGKYPSARLEIIVSNEGMELDL